MPDPLPSALRQNYQPTHSPALIPTLAFHGAAGDFLAVLNNRG